MSEATEQQLRAAFGALSYPDVMRLIRKYSHPLNKKEPSLHHLSSDSTLTVW